jgi:acetyltransferase
MENYSDLELFVNPQSVALVGASTRTGPGSFNVLERMLESGYRGEIYPVNPRGGSIMGVPAYRSVQEIKAPVDLAIVATPRTAVPEVVRQCVVKCIRAIIIITQGFSDAGDEAGMRMHREIVETVRGTGTRVVGPNTLGVINNFINFNTAFVSFTTAAAPVGVVCQSGIFLAGANDFSGGIGIGIDIGNSADVGFTDCLEYLARDPRIKVINLHIEGLRDGRRFLEAARRAAAAKPVLALKTGSSEEGARAASSHSGSLAGEDAVFSTAFAQSGIIRVENSSLLSDLNRTFLTYREMRGRRVGVITISGGAGIMAVDACSKFGLETAVYSPETVAALARVFPDWMKAGNPADIWPAGMARGYLEIAARVLDQVLSDDNVDAALFITPAYLDPGEDPLNITGLVNDTAARHPYKPLALWVFGPHKDRYAQEFQKTGLVVAYGSPDHAMYCLAQLYRYHNQIKDQARETYRAPAGINRSRVQSILDGGRSAGVTTLNEQALDIVEACGIPVVRRGLAGTPEEALRLAGQLGYPVAMKIVSPDITHKSDAGGVRLNIKTGEELVRSFEEMMRETGNRAPGARIKGVLLQNMVSGGTEVILGGRRDPQFGPVLVYGLGGVFTELLRDVSFRVAPVTRREALEMIKETKSFKILAGARGKQPGDIDGLVDCITRLGALIHDHPEIAEVDINPLVVKPEGCIALDARIITGS